MKDLYKFMSGPLVLVIFLMFYIPANSFATVFTIDLALTGGQEVPPNISTATGTLIGTYDDATNVLSFTMMFNGLVAPSTAAHFHGPASPGVNGPVQIPIPGFPVGVTSGSVANSVTLTAQQESDLLCGLWYVNIHSQAFPGGEIRSQVKEGTTSGNITNFAIALVGANDVPPSITPACGTCIGTFDNTTNILSITVMFNGLLGVCTAAHIHGPAAAGFNGPVLIPFAGFPVGGTSGVYTNSFVLDPTQKGYLFSGLLYVNVHSTVYPGGEMRGQLTEGTLVGNCGCIPTLSQWGLIILCLLLLSTGMVFIYKRQNAFAFAGNVAGSGLNASIFNKALFAKIFPVLLGLSSLVLFLSFLYYGDLAIQDVVGTVISAAIVAFMVQLVIGSRRDEQL